MVALNYRPKITPNTFDADDKFAETTGTRDGSLFTADWVLARSFEGRVFVANLGTVTAPATFGAGDIDETEYDLFISVPSGTTVVPLEINVTVETWGTVLIFQTMAKAGVGGVTGAGTSITPQNIRSDSPYASNCTVTGAATLTSATAITGHEFYRDGHIIARTPTAANNSASAGQETTFNWSHKQAGGYAPVLKGDSQLGVYVSGQAGTGFITVVYAEFPSTRI